MSTQLKDIKGKEVFAKDLIYSKLGGGIKTLEEAMSEGDMKWLIDLWNMGWKQQFTVYGKYDPENAPDKNKPFQAWNGALWLSYADALEMIPTLTTTRGRLENQALARLSIKTHFPLYNWYLNGGKEDTRQLFFYDQLLEYVDVTLMGPSSNNITQMFWSCRNLHTIKGLDLTNVTVAANTGAAFDYCASLANVEIKGLKVNIALGASAKLTCESLRYLVDNAANSTAITVTVHADVYANLTGGDDEWGKVFNDAVAKQIAFVSA